MSKERLRESLSQAVARAQEHGDLPADLSVSVELQPPRDRRWGDLSTNLPMVVASATNRQPREVAEIILQHLQLPEGLVERAEVAGAGFLNFAFSSQWLRGVVRAVITEGDRFGSSHIGDNKRLLLEFVSANPTGPVAVVQGRAAAIGDCLARLFERIGWRVSREYYVNDATNSTQVQRFAETLEARYLQRLGRPATVPEDGYQGEYVVEMANELVASEGDRYLHLPQEERLAQLTAYSLRKIVESHKRDMEAFGIEFDTWFLESSLYENDEVGAAMSVLESKGHVYEGEGALWLRATDYGDDQDHVLVRRDGRPSYLAADIAYHKNKFERGFDRLVDIWGPDHHGHVVRLKAGVQALGYDPDRFEILIHQIVRLFRGSEMVRMSKRAGDIIPLSGLIEDVGTDAARFFFLMQSMESHLDFDLELAKKQAAENPVYYVQYAHARICSILRSAEEQGVPLPDIGTVNLDLLEAPDELELMRKIGELPEEISQAASRYEPHRLTRHARELAATFHGFYTNCRVLGEAPALTAARLSLVTATRIVLGIVLDTLGVSAPERM